MSHASRRNHEPETMVLLPSMASAASIHAATREAWRMFVDQSKDWGKAELLMWAIGFVHHVASAGIGGARTASIDELEPIDARTVDRKIRVARARAVNALSAIKDPSARLELGWHALAAGWVVRCCDASGAVVYVPASGIERVQDRLLALVAADLLTAPEDFERATLCAECGGTDLPDDPCCSGALSQRDTELAPASHEIETRRAA